MPFNIPNTDDIDWSVPLRNHLGQLNDPDTGGFNVWNTSATRPWANGNTTKTNEENYSGFNKELGLFERWNSTSKLWEPLSTKTNFDFWTDVTRPANPLLNQTGINTDRKVFERWTGSAWEPITNYLVKDTPNKGVSEELSLIDNRQTFTDHTIFSNKIYTCSVSRDTTESNERFRKWTINCYDLNLVLLWTVSYWNNSIYRAVPQQISVDSTGIYVTGYENYDNSNLSLMRIRIEKRNLNSGALEWLQTHPVTQNSFSSYSFNAIDTSGLYVTNGKPEGVDLMKYDKTTGTLQWSATQSRTDLGGGTALLCFGVKVDSSGIYLHGSYRREYSDGQIWLQKRNLSNGQLMWNILENQDGNSQEILDLELDASGVYLGIRGIKCLVQKRSLTNGALTWVYHNPSVALANATVRLCQSTNEIIAFFNVESLYVRLNKTSGTEIEESLFTVFTKNIFHSNFIYGLDASMLIKYKPIGKSGFYGSVSWQEQEEKVRLISNSLAISGNSSIAGSLSVSNNTSFGQGISVSENGSGNFIRSHFPSHNRALVGMEKNLLFNPDNQFGTTLSITGSGGYSASTALSSWFDGFNVPYYSPDGIDPNNPCVITIANLPNAHIQAGGVFGFSTRYWPALRYKIEAIENYGGSNNRVTLADYSNIPLSPSLSFSNHALELPHGSYISFIITIYEGIGVAGANGFGRVGISQIYYLHSEHVRAYDGIIPRAMWGGAAGRCGLGTKAPEQMLHVIGNVLATGTVTSGSDERWKENIQPIDQALEQIENIDGVLYNWIDKEERGSDLEAGVIAQQLEKAGVKGVVKEDREGYKHVSYNGLIALLIEGIKELSSLVKEQELRIKQLEDK